MALIVPRRKKKKCGRNMVTVDSAVCRHHDENFPSESSSSTFCVKCFEGDFPPEDAHTLFSRSKFLVIVGGGLVLHNQLVMYSIICAKKLNLISCEREHEKYSEGNETILHPLIQSRLQHTRRSTEGWLFEEGGFMFFIWEQNSSTKSAYSSHVLIQLGHPNQPVIIINNLSASSSRERKLQRTHNKRTVRDNVLRWTSLVVVVYRRANKYKTRVFLVSTLHHTNDRGDRFCWWVIPLSPLMGTWTYGARGRLSLQVHTMQKFVID